MTDRVLRNRKSRSRSRSNWKHQSSDAALSAPPPPVQRPHNVMEWSLKDVQSWLEFVGMDDDVATLFEDQRVDGFALSRIKEIDLVTGPLAVATYGDAKRVFYHIDLLRQYGDQGSRESYRARLAKSEFQFARSAAKYMRVWHRHKPEFESWLKSAFAAGFVAIAGMLSAVAIVTVNARTPDQHVYPPLPDIILDSVPRIPWAFAAAEYIILIEALLFGIVLAVHRHRAVIFRRFCLIYGTVFMFRCVTMMVTSLSVPQKDFIDCTALSHAQSTPTELISAAWHIFTGAGLSVADVTSCGDYMYSGHTATLALFNFFILEYTPDNPSTKALHVFSWVACIFGIFFVLAGHQHYTLDCLMAFYITHRLFQYYHLCALTQNSPALNNESVEETRQFRKWTQFAFPMFEWMESDTHGVVGHDFEWPWNAKILRG